MFERLFRLKKNNTDIRTELIAGVTTFLTMSYVIIVSPSILSTGGISFSGALTATILVSAFSSILMGLVANLPFALAPGMGVTAFFTFQVVMGMGVPWETALGTVFISGLIFLFLSIIRVREMIVQAIPDCIRYGVAYPLDLFHHTGDQLEFHFLYVPQSSEGRSKGDPSNALRDRDFCSLSLDLGVIGSFKWQVKRKNTSP